MFTCGLLQTALYFVSPISTTATESLNRRLSKDLEKITWVSCNPEMQDLRKSLKDRTEKANTKEDMGKKEERVLNR